MVQWMHGYRDSLDAKVAHLKVRQNSSHKYTSHHCVQETGHQGCLIINYVIPP